jgi:hypothetical protein
MFMACEKPEAPEDPNRPQKLEIGDDKVLDISQIFLQKSSFGNQGSLFILGEGLNYNKEAFSIEGTGDYIQLNVIVTFGNDLEGGIYRFSQFFGDPFTINFGQVAENYSWGSCLCTNVTDAIMEVNPLETENFYEIDLIGRNAQDKVFKTYFKGEILIQLF